MNYIPLYSPCLGPALLALRGTLQPQRLLHENPLLPHRSGATRARERGGVATVVYTSPRQTHVGCRAQLHTGPEGGKTVSQAMRSRAPSIYGNVDKVADLEVHGFEGLVVVLAQPGGVHSPNLGVDLGTGQPELKRRPAPAEPRVQQPG